VTGGGYSNYTIAYGRTIDWQSCVYYVTLHYRGKRLISIFKQVIRRHIASVSLWVYTCTSCDVKLMERTFHSIQSQENVCLHSSQNGWTAIFSLFNWQCAEKEPWVRITGKCSNTVDSFNLFFWKNYCVKTQPLYLYLRAGEDYVAFQYALFRIAYMEFQTRHYMLMTWSNCNKNWRGWLREPQRWEKTKLK
jgi:hypothetical protein